jgi:hypothetical protein
MASYESHFARQEIKKRRKAFRKHWWVVAAVGIPLCVMAALLFEWLVRAQGLPAWALGPIAVVMALWMSRSGLDGTYQLESGIEAEGWTSKDLRKALGRGWHIVDHISFGKLGDVDHVAVGPGGVFAVETKYTDSTQDSRAGRAIVESWIDQSWANARHVRLLLKHNYGHEIAVRPIVVTSGSKFLSLRAQVEDKDVVRRRNLRGKAAEWRAMPKVLSHHQVEAIRAALLDWRGIRAEFERDRAA